MCLYWYLGIMIVKAIVSYDGFNYAGWQKQENALGIQQAVSYTHLTLPTKLEV